MEQEELYRRQALDEEPIPLLVQAAVVLYGPPSKEEIVVTVRSIQVVRAGGPSGMQSEHLEIWLRDDT